MTPLTDMFHRRLTVMEASGRIDVDDLLALREIAKDFRRVEIVAMAHLRADQEEAERLQRENERLEALRKRARMIDAADNIVDLQRRLV